MKSFKNKIIIVIIVLAIIAFRFYKKYERKEKQKIDQLRATEQFLRYKKHQDSLRLKEYEKAVKKRSDSLNSIRKSNFDDGMKKLKEAQKRIQQEIDNEKKN